MALPVGAANGDTARSLQKRIEQPAFAQDGGELVLEMEGSKKDEHISMLEGFKVCTVPYLVLAYLHCQFIDILPKALLVMLHGFHTCWSVDHARRIGYSDYLPSCPNCVVLQCMHVHSHFFWCRCVI